MKLGKARVTMDFGGILLFTVLGGSLSAHMVVSIGKGVHLRDHCICPPHKVLFLNAVERA